jgi:hypothetical protein
LRRAFVFALVAMQEGLSSKKSGRIKPRGA